MTLYSLKPSLLKNKKKFFLFIPNKIIIKLIKKLYGVKDITKILELLIFLISLKISQNLINLIFLILSLKINFFFDSLAIK